MVIDFKNHTEEGPSFGSRYELKNQGVGKLSDGLIEALDNETGKLVHIKELAEYGGYETLDEFLEQASNFALLSHPNLINIIDYGVNSKNLPYIVFEKFDGPHLQAVLAESGGLDIEDALRIIQQIIKAVEFIHSEEFLHGSLSLVDIHLFNDENSNLSAKIGGLLDAYPNSEIDYNEDDISKQSFFSPEQIETEDDDSRSDVFAIGCILYSIITGKYLNLDSVYEARSNNDLLTIIEDALLPIPLENIIIKALEFNPETRFQSCTELLGAIGAVQRIIPKTSKRKRSSLVTTEEIVGEDEDDKKNASIDSSSDLVKEHIDSITFFDSIGPNEIAEDLVSDEHDEPVSDEHDEPVSDEHDEPVSDEHDELVSDDYDEPVSDEHVELVSDEHVEPVSDEHVEPVSDEHDEPVSDEHDELVSDEHDEPVSDEHVEPVSDEHDDLVSDEHDEPVSDEHDDLVSDEDDEPVSDEHVEPVSDQTNDSEIDFSDLDLPPDIDELLEMSEKNEDTYSEATKENIHTETQDQEDSETESDLQDEDERLDFSDLDSPLNLEQQIDTAMGESAELITQQKFDSEEKQSNTTHTDTEIDTVSNQSSDHSRQEVTPIPSTSLADSINKDLDTPLRYSPQLEVSAQITETTTMSAESISNSTSIQGERVAQESEFDITPITDFENDIVVSKPSKKSLKNQMASVYRKQSTLKEEREVETVGSKIKTNKEQELTENLANENHHEMLDTSSESEEDVIVLDQNSETASELNIDLVVNDIREKTLNEFPDMESVLDTTDHPLEEEVLVEEEVASIEELTDLEITEHSDSTDSEAAYSSNLEDQIDQALASGSFDTSGLEQLLESPVKNNTKVEEIEHQFNFEDIEKPDSLDASQLSAILHTEHEKISDLEEESIAEEFEVDSTIEEPFSRSSQLDVKEEEDDDEEPIADEFEVDSTIEEPFSRSSQLDIKEEDDDDEDIDDEPIADEFEVDSTIEEPITKEAEKFDFAPLPDLPKEDPVKQSEQPIPTTKTSDDPYLKQITLSGSYAEPAGLMNLIDKSVSKVDHKSVSESSLDSSSQEVAETKFEIPVISVDEKLAPEPQSIPTEDYPEVAQTKFEIPIISVDNKLSPEPPSIQTASTIEVFAPDSVESKIDSLPSIDYEAVSTSLIDDSDEIESPKIKTSIELEIPKEVAQITDSIGIARPATEIKIPEKDIPKSTSALSKLSHEAIKTKRRVASTIIGSAIQNNYEKLALIGSSDIYDVFQAKESITQRIVTAKTLKPLEDAVMVEFVRRAQEHAHLLHSNIVRSVGCLDTSLGRPYFIMDHLNGITLHDLLESVERIETPEEFTEIFTQICGAIEYAHSRNVFHGNINPNNVVLLEVEGRIIVKVLDFGMSAPRVVYQKITNTYPSVDQAKHMSPEQFTDNFATPQSDIYQLGILAVKMLTGKEPITGDTYKSIMDIAVELKEPNCRLSESRSDMYKIDDLNFIIDQTMHPDENRRLQDAGELKDAVSHWLQTVQLEQHASKVAQDSNLKSIIQNQIKLRQTEYSKSDTIVMKFTTFAGGGSRKSPIKTIVGLILKVTISLGLLFYAFANFDQLKTMYLETSRQMSSQINKKDEVADEEPVEIESANDISKQKKSTMITNVEPSKQEGKNAHKVQTKRKFNTIRSNYVAPFRDSLVAPDDINKVQINKNKKVYPYLYTKEKMQKFKEVSHFSDRPVRSTEGDSKIERVKSK